MSEKLKTFVFKENFLLSLFLFLGSLFILVSRWLTRSQYFYHWDGVQFALALEKFDLSQHQPHPPGYILYIALGRIIDLFVGDPHRTLILLSILFSVLSFIILFYFASSLFGRLNAYLSALFLLFIPIFWFHGSVALIYAAEAFWVILLAYLAWLTIKGNSFQYFLWFSLTLGIAGGFRESLLLFLIPLWLYLAWRMRLKRALWGLLVLIVSILAWFVFLLLLSGGLVNYSKLLIATFANLRSGFPEPTSVLSVGFQAVWNNLRLVLNIISQSFNIAVLAFLIFTLVIFIPKLREGDGYHLDYRKWWLFGLLIVPALLFYLFVFLFNPGYLLFLVVLLTPLVVEGALIAIRFWAERYKEARQKLHWQGLAIGSFLLLMIGYSIFFWTRPSPLEFKPFLLSFYQIQQADRLLDHQLKAVKEFFDPETSFILFDGGEFIHAGFRHYMYYLPEYRVYAAVPLPLRFWEPEVESAWLGYNRSSQVVDKIYIDSSIEKAAFVQSGLNFPTGYRALSLPNNLFMAYFDLSDEGDRQKLARYKVVQFLP